MQKLSCKLPLLLAGLLFSFPFLIPSHQPPLVSFYSEWWAGLIGLVLVGVALFRNLDWRFPSVALPVLGLIFLLIVQAFSGHSLDGMQTLFALAFLLWGVLLMWAARVLVGKVGVDALVVWLAWVLVIGGAISALFAVLQSTQTEALFAGVMAHSALKGAPYGNLGQPNHLAHYLALGLASVLYLLAFAKLRTKLGLLVFALGGLLVLGLALTASRSAWLYLISFTVLGWGWFYFHQHAESKKLARSATLFLLVFSLSQFVLMQTPKHVEKAALTTPTVPTASERILQDGAGLPVRLVYWQHAWEMFLAQPLAGVGYQHFAWKNFELTAKDVEQGKVLPPALYQQATNNAHNLFLQFLAEFGLGGALVVLGLLYALLRQLTRPWTPERWWAWAVLSVIAIHSLLEFPLWYAYFWGVAAFVLGILDKGAAETKSHAWLKTLAWLGVSAGVLILAAMMVSYPPLERAFQYAPERNPAYTKTDLQKDLLKIQGNPFFAPQLAFLFTSVEIPVDNPASWPVHLGFNSQALAHKPNPGLVYRQVLLLALNGQNDAALRLMQLAARVYPDRLPGFLVSLRAYAPFNPGVQVLMQSGQGDPIK